MYTSIYLLLFLLVSLHITAANVHRLASPPDATLHLSSYPKLPQRPISFSPPSQHIILTDFPTPNEPSLIRGTINIPSLGLQQPISVNFSRSPQACVPLIFEVPYIITDLSQQLLSEHLNGILFPFSSDSQTHAFPIYLVANITEQLYRSKFVLSLSLKLSSLESGLKEIETPRWRSIIRVLEQSARELDTDARKRDGTGLGSMLVLEAEIEEVHVLAEWRLWRVVNGLATICES